MRLNQSRVLKNLSRYSTNMRCVVDTVLLHQICQYFLPRNILEIGFFQGQTLGIIAEAVEFDSDFVAVDKEFGNNKIFKVLFPELETKVRYIQDDSNNVVYHENFDFVCIDGDHRYSYVKQDVKTVLPCLKKDSVLYMDDINTPDVVQVIHEDLLGSHDMVPFLKGDQGMFFHRVDHNASDFLMHLMSSKYNKFMSFTNINFSGHTILNVSAMPVFQDSHNIFCSALSFYDL